MDNRLLIRWILLLVDCLLITISFFTGAFLRFGGEHHLLMDEYLISKIITFILVIQIVFYCFGLYQLINIRDGRKTARSLLESLGISFLLLAIIYYSIPYLAIGRGLLFLSLVVTFVLTFFSRFIFSHVCRNIIKERILIVGSGELAKKIIRTIYENSRDNYKIIGIVEE